MNRGKLSSILLMIILVIVSACTSDTTLPTQRATLAPDDSEPTVDAGSGFDPDLGNDTGSENEPTPTRETDANLSGGDVESGARGTGFSAQITDGSIDTINDSGEYKCNFGGHQIMSGSTVVPSIIFTVPVDDPIKTHTFVDADSAGTARVTVALTSATQVYTDVTSGTLTLDEVPLGAGDFVSGSFEFTVLDFDENEIGVRGDFAFEATGSDYCEF